MSLYQIAMPVRQFSFFESRWWLFVVSLAAAGMLVAFHSVVKGATTAGELRRQDTATQAAAVIRCHALPNWAISKNCLKALNDQTLAISTTVFAPTHHPIFGARP